MRKSRYRTARVLALVLFLLFSLVSAIAQNSPGTAVTYRIAEVDYRISGLTLQPFLEEYLDIKIGSTFPNVGALQSYVDSLHRSVLNNRIFTESSSVAFELIGEDDPQNVRIIVTTFNSWSALAVPLVKYSNSEGLSFAIRYKDFNFLGTMEPLGLNLDYYVETGEAEAAANFTLYAKALNARWALAVAGDLLYKPDAGVRPNGSLSLSSSYRFGALGQNWHVNPLLSYLYERDYLRHTFSGGLATGFGFHAGLDWSFSANTYLKDQYATSHYPYMTNGMGVSTSIQLADMPYFGALTLAPSAGLFGTFGFEAGTYTDAGVSLDAGLSFGRVDLVRNMRKGVAAGLSASFAKHFILPLPTDAYDFTLSAQTSAFTVFNPALGFDFRLFGQWLATWTLLGENSSFDWGAYVRGIKDSRYGDLGFVANMQVPINFAQGLFFGSERLDAEVFLIPFIDAGYVRSSPGSAFSVKDDAIFCAGLDIVIFPEYARAFTYRLSLGYDMMDYLETRDFEANKIEAWLGLGLHF